MRIAINSQKEQQPINRKQLQKAYRELFDSSEAQIILEDLANMSGMYRTNFVQNNTNHTSFLEGQRSLFLYICSHLEDDKAANIEGS